MPSSNSTCHGWRGADPVVRTENANAPWHFHATLDEQHRVGTRQPWHVEFELGMPEWPGLRRIL